MRGEHGKLTEERSKARMEKLGELQLRGKETNSLCKTRPEPPLSRAHGGSLCPDMPPFHVPQVSSLPRAEQGSFPHAVSTNRGFIMSRGPCSCAGGCQSLVKRWALGGQPSPLPIRPSLYPALRCRAHQCPRELHAVGPWSHEQDLWG